MKLMPSIILLLLLILLGSPLHAGEGKGVTRLSEAEIIRLGERMYRDGILPNGESMEAYIRGDIPVDSTAFSCSSCHQRAGLGSFEGGVVTPPTTGRELYKPYQRPPSLADKVDVGGRYIYAKTIMQRPAYTEESLAHALRTGIDPAGQEFNDVMPRYPLGDEDMAVMIAYLNKLSANYSPGASDKEIHFATIITEEVSRDDREALLTILHRFINVQNQQVKMYKEFVDFGFKPTLDMRNSFRKASLTIWELKGEPSTWREQLMEYYRKEPVFAVLGGISSREWRPIHEFCEKEHLPCLFPITDLPVVSGESWYTFYFNKGYFQEGEGAARFLHREHEQQKGLKILQIVEDSPVGRALADGFDRTRADLGDSAVETVVLDRAALGDGVTLSKQLHRGANLILLWAGDEILPSLATAAATLSQGMALYLSSTALGASTVKIDENLRERVFLTFPYRMTPYVGTQEGTESRIPFYTTWRSFGDKRISSRTATMLTQAALQGLRRLYDDLYQDHLLDVMSMQMDQTVTDYERLSFGPGQRYAAKGCYILQLGPGEEPQLIQRSDWVTH